MSEVRRTSHPYFMWDNICTQPEIFDKTLGEEARIKDVAMELVESGIRKIFLIGAGTSYHAAIFGRYALSELSRIPAEAFQAFEFLNYPPLDLNSHSALIALSQSGVSTITHLAGKLAKERGAKVIALTNERISPLTDLADNTILVPGGIEKGPATRSYTGALIDLCLFSAALGESSESEVDPKLKSMHAQLKSISYYARTAIAHLENPIRQLAGQYYGGEFFVIGGGPNYATALEGALKIKETIFRHAEGYLVEEAAHGPFLMWDENTVVVIIATSGKSCLRALDLLRVSKETGAKSILITNRHHEGLVSDHIIEVPSEQIHEILTPILNIIPLQIFAYDGAIKMGSNPDLARKDLPKYLRARAAAAPKISEFDEKYVKV